MGLVEEVTGDYYGIILPAGHTDHQECSVTYWFERTSLEQSDDF